MNWVRARKPEQKAVRRSEILDAARALFSELPYEKISLNGIARAAEISKPNVYRYFSTREEIFLVIYEAERDRFIEMLIDRLTKIRSSDVVSRISSVWVEVALAHRTLLDLLPLLSISMEKNSSVEQLVHFKKTGSEHLGKLVQTLEQLYPKLDQQKWMFVVQCTFSMMAGLWPLANPGESLLQALHHPDVNLSPWDFPSLMEQGLSALILGTSIETKGK